MKRRRIPLLGLVLLTLAPVAAQEPGSDDTLPPLPPPTSSSNAYPEVTCTSNDDVACAEALELAGDTRDGLAPLLQLGKTWRFPVHIHVVTPDDPLAGKIDREAVRVLAVGNTMVVEAYLPVDDPMAKEFIQRQYVTVALWERFFAKTTTFDQHTDLTVVPLWLVEGVREWLNEDPTHNREAIVNRALFNHTAPTLAEVTGWTKLSDDRLLGLWQRAFSFYLFDSLVRGSERRSEFQAWLSSFSTPGDSGRLHFPTEANWQDELDDVATRERNLVYTWQETSDELDADSKVTYATSKTAQVKICALDDIGGQKRTPALLQAVQERLDLLTALELRAHPAWHSTLEAYRDALAALLDEGSTANVPRLLHIAHALREAEQADHEKLVDYVNWYEVTHDFGETNSLFDNYLVTARQVEKVVADPAHPNPIRVGVLQVEQRLEPAQPSPVAP
jgi:hypothetical protein